jgi:Fic family protein
MVNRYREKWAMNDVIETVGYDRAKQLIEYYFRCNRIGHPLNWFLYNFDKLDDFLLKSEQDKKYREDLREQTKNMVEQELNEL